MAGKGLRVSTYEACRGAGVDGDRPANRRQWRAVWFLAQNACRARGVSPYRARAAIDRLDSEGMIDVVSRYSDDGGQLANGICLTERGKWYLEGVRTGMLVQEMLEDEVADR